MPVNAAASVKVSSFSLTSCIELKTQVEKKTIFDGSFVRQHLATLKPYSHPNDEPQMELQVDRPGPVVWHRDE